MAVEILWDSSKQIAAMYDNTTDQAFGPVFSGPSADTEVQEFLDWLKESGSPHWAVASPMIFRGCDGSDASHYSPVELERVVKHWCDLPRGVRDAGS